MKYLKPYKLFESQETEMDVYDQGLTELPPLPPNLQYLYCSYNKLTFLPDLPPSLQDLYCKNNQLKELPELPPNLQELICDNNELTSLPPLPPSLKELYCANNELTSLPPLPPNLQELACSDNPFLEPLPVWCHERFELANLYDQELIDKFGSYAFQVKYLKEKPQNFERLAVFGYDKGIKEEFPFIFQSKRTGII